MSDIDAGFSALSHPLRRSMLARLGQGRRTISQLVGGAGMTFAAVSRHLRVLEQAGLVVRRIEGREHYFSASPSGFRGVENWVRDHAALWQESLERLKHVMESEMVNALSAHAEVFVNAPPERVFDAWCDSRTAARFLLVGNAALGEVRLDPRVGGEVFVAMRDEHTEILHRGAFVVVARPSRLVFTWVSQPTRLRLTVVSVDFIAEGTGTRVRLLHEGFAEESDARSHEGGWTGILTALAETMN